MKKLICTILALAALLSMGGCYKEKSKNKTCTHNWDKTTGICTLCNKQCTHKWDNSSEFCSVCGISCLQVMRYFIKKDPDIVKNGLYTKAFERDENDNENFSLTLAVTDSEVFIALRTDEDLDHRTHVSILSIKIENAVAKNYFYEFSSEYSYFKGSTNIKSVIEGYFAADQLNNTSKFTHTKEKYDLHPSGDDKEALDRALEEEACISAKNALKKLDKVLQTEHLGFTAANLGFRY